MNKLYRLVQADGLSLTLFGERIGIRVNAVDALRSVLARVPKGYVLGGGPVVKRLYSILVGSRPSRHLRSFHVLYANSQRLARTEDFDQLLEAFEFDLSFHLALAQRRLFIHAGVVAWKGRGIVMPGPSMTGKTTLVQEFLRAGATYYSDEYAVLDDDGWLHGFPRMLSVRRDNSDDRARVSAEDIGAPIGAVPIRLNSVIVTRYESGAEWQPSRVSSGQGILALLANALGAREHPIRSLNILQRALADATVFEGSRGDAADMVSSLSKLMEED